ncbi:MAG: hypothetical protein QXQ02_09280 [Halobacteria archaeon]
MRFEGYLSALRERKIGFDVKFVKETDGENEEKDVFNTSKDRGLRGAFGDREVQRGVFEAYKSSCSVKEVEMLQGMDFVDRLNPLNYVKPSEYTSIWTMLFRTILEGFWARLFAIVFLFLAFWFGVYRQRFIPGITFFVLSILVTYFGGIFRFLFG